MTSANDIQQAAAALRAGRLVGMPTETVYGLAGDALNSLAVLAIFEAKKRPSFDPLIVHVADIHQAWTVGIPTPRAEKLAKACWPGPLTLILQRRSIIPDVVTSGLETVGIRCPDHPIARALIEATGRPLAAPSANIFGRISPTTAEHVRSELGHAVDIVLDGGDCRVGIESTIIVPDPSPIILRPGGVSRERLEDILGEKIALADTTLRASHLPQLAPGMLASHYAPRTPLRLKDMSDPWPNDSSVVYLAFKHGPASRSRPHEILSPSGDLAEAATHLFAALRRLDALGASAIIAERVPPHGLGLGINDRLRRAAGLG